MYLNFSAHSPSRQTLVTSAAARRHHRRRLLKYSPHSPTQSPVPTIFKLSDEGLQITLKPPSNSFQNLETKLNQFVDYGQEIYDDFRTVVTVNSETGGVVIGIKRSSAEFLVGLFLSSLIVIVGIKGLFKSRKNEGEMLVYKRDRSLGGKEVLVGKGEVNWKSSRKSSMSLDSGEFRQERRKSKTLSKRRKEEQLPQWWPLVVNSMPLETDDKEVYQRIVDQLIQVFMDLKMNGKDISANDIVQLRHICKTYGVKASINTENARDSLYRMSINFVLSYCESISRLSASIEINGEDSREFIAGLADNIGLERGRAARMVSAAVAARTRSKILQAWALEVQNKHSEALVELYKVCLIHRIFPPEESSPEMEMVAQGLEKSLNVEQRESILNSFITACGNDIEPSLVEALGLVSSID